MPKRRRATNRPAPAPSPSPATTRVVDMASIKPPTGAVREIDVLALAAAVLCVLLGFATRHHLNPDGVSYLDLASAVREGRWSDFVQSYWSPLYPAVIGLLELATGSSPIATVTLAHSVNVAVVLAGLAVVWRWARQVHDPMFGRLALAAYLMCSARPPRMEAVTPDLMLVAVMTGLAYELVFHRGSRWVRTGLLLALVYVTKTSSWPWLLCAAALLGWNAARHGTAARTGRALALAAAAMLIWIIPMSVDAGGVTLTSAGRLNASWYLTGPDLRTPDTDDASHVRFRQLAVPSGALMSWAEYVSPQWTYEPWSDPAAWDAGRTARRPGHFDLFNAVRYWGRVSWYVILYWTAFVTAGVVIPALAIQWRRGMWQQPISRHRDAAIGFALGVIGVAQFVAVHAEPRLLAPYVLFGALAALAWAWTEWPARTWWRHLLSAALLIVVVPIGVSRIVASVATDRQIRERLATVARFNQTVAHDTASRLRILIVGAAIPPEPDVYLQGGRIVAQIPPRQMSLLTELPPNNQRAFLVEHFGRRADVVWYSNPDGRLQMVGLR